MRVPCITGGLIVATWLSAARAAGPYQATGVKVGEVTDRSAIVWVRLTEKPERNPGPAEFPKTLPGDAMSVQSLPGECPGAAGQIRLRYGEREDLADAAATGWVKVAADDDYTHEFHLTNLKPATLYHYEALPRPADGAAQGQPLRGSFRTAPPPDQPASVSFTVITGQAYRDLDDPAGFLIYDAMGRLKPNFFVPTGDTVYYDNDPPYATSPALARYHWHRMYSLPRLVRFHLAVPGLWEKDDHDTVFNDCWPGMQPAAAGSLTFAEGCRIFRQQVPMSDQTYRTFRWGKLLQVWLVEGRDFRSPNRLPDGPDKTIWGEQQKKWLQDTLLASDAAWRVLVSPTPIVGPDRGNKADNHANATFAHEGQWFRRWAAQHCPGNFFVACGDRHWQYHSVDPKTGVQEFSCGPASDRHAGGSPGHDPAYHRFHRVKGGFLSIAVTPGEAATSTIHFRFHDVAGEVVYEHHQTR
ncbi:MAG: alkaline phosphatase D family protein [Planctomycetes bacterium]|nr:alkaline phosphatase D family protein [Planctomycetota bacterium]